MKFVMVETLAGKWTPVNLETVKYVRLTPSNHVALVFGAFPGGLHELTVKHLPAEIQAFFDEPDHPEISNADVLLAAAPKTSRARKAA